jgi:hypothetical protein
MVEAQTMISRTGWLEVSNIARQEGKVIIPALDPLNIDPDSPEAESSDELDPLVHGPLRYNKSSADWKTEVKNAKQLLQEAKLANCPAPQSAPVPANANTSLAEGVVKVVDLEYLCEEFKPSIPKDLETIEDISAKSMLNADQKRAFKIVAQHAVSPAFPQLKMYLGGMGGTGKSQVIKCLIKFFQARNESHKFIVLSPTGTAAALLNGSTYHSVLGIDPRGKDEDGAAHRSEATSVNDAATRLKGVRYIFVDEVSMTACHELSQTFMTSLLVGFSW